MRSRRLHVALVSLLMCLAACSTSHSNAKSTGWPTKHTGALTEIRYINPLPGDALWDNYGRCITDEAHKHGVHVRTVGPPGGNVDVAAMEDMVSQAIATNAQAIVTWSAGAGAAFDALFAQARAKGIVIATIKSAGATKNQNVETGPHAGDQDKLALAAIARRPGHSYVGIMTQRPGYPQFGNTAALKAAVARYPNVSIVATAYDYGAFSNDVNVASTLLAANPSVNVLLKYNPDPRALSAITEENRVGKVVAYTGYEPGAAQTMTHYIADGLVGGVLIDDSCGTGRLVVDKLLDVWAGKPTNSWYPEGLRYVTPAEFKDLIKAGTAP